MHTTRYKQITSRLTNDHSNVESWIGNLTTQDLNHSMIKLLWTSGEYKANKYLSQLGLAIIPVKNDKITVLNPFGSNDPYKHLEKGADDIEFEFFNQALEL